MQIVIPERLPRRRASEWGHKYQRVSALMAGGMGQATIIEML